MKLAVYGAGYVGLVTSACLAKIGHDVICADVNKQKIAMLNLQQCPIYEIGLPEIISEQVEVGRLKFTSDVSQAIRSNDLHIIATGTPSFADGSCDLSQVFSIVSQVAEESVTDGLIVIKSTVPLGTSDKLEDLVNTKIINAGKQYTIDIASNPEFLREGNAVYDFMQADRIVIGGSDSAMQQLSLMYQPLVEQNIPLLKMSRRSAELTKYASNAMLACRVSFINQISRIAENAGADIDQIRLGIGLDKRIGQDFLNPGIGYGGSCFPKDLRALIYIAEELQVDNEFLKMITKINDMQKNWVIEQLVNFYPDGLTGLTIGIWGLAFKPGTDDMREASSLVIINLLLELGANIRVYDPVALESARDLFAEGMSITWCDSAEHVLEGNLDALVIATEWSEFKEFSLGKLSKFLGNAPLIDGRNCYDLAKVKLSGIANYFSVGRPKVSIETEVFEVSV